MIQSMFQFTDNDVTHTESSSPNKLSYITGKIWEPEDGVYNNTITAQAWQISHHSQLIIHLTIDNTTNQLHFRVMEIMAQINPIYNVPDMLVLVYTRLPLSRLPTH